MNYISKNFVLFTTMEKKIKNSKYLCFILKKEFFETLGFLPYIP